MELSEVAYKKLPVTLEECDSEISEITDQMNIIDVQFSRVKAGLFEPAEDWHPRALAAKGHMMKRLRTLRLQRQKFLEQEAEAKRAKIAAEKASAHEAVMAAHASARRNKARFRALYDWAWGTFPEHRTEMQRLLAELEQNGTET